jgi:hypothetical protein
LTPVFSRGYKVAWRWSVSCGLPVLLPLRTFNFSQKGNSMKMLSKLISQLLIVSMILLPFSARAGMIGTDQAIATAQDIVNVDKVRDFVSRGDVVKQFEAMGLSAATAQDRVNAMTQEEINRIAGKIDTLPAGADSTAAWVGGVILIGLIIYLVWYK